MMTEEFLFTQMKMIRGITLQRMESITEETADLQPVGFRNTIRWNVGHIYVVQQLFVDYFSGESIDLADGYREFFAPKTSPADWKSTPPTLAEIREKLAQQPDQIMEKYSGRLEENTVKPFKLGPHGELTTLKDTLNFSLYHEGVHSGFINGIKCASNVN
jgi:uncharacterized damage-inducible protein DinB